MKPGEWLEPRTEITQTEGGRYTGAKLFFEPYHHPRMCCIKCFREVLEFFMVNQMCKSCLNEEMEEL